MRVSLEERRVCVAPRVGREEEADGGFDAEKIGLGEVGGGCGVSGGGAE